MTKAVLFDLDNTLYHAQQYFLGAFNSISKYISLKYNISWQEVYETLAGLWREKTSLYPYLFNDLLSLLHLDQGNLEDIVKLFNEYSGWMEPYPDVIPTLKVLKERNYKVSLVTDGNTERQRRKLEMLSLKSYFDTVVYAKEIEPKPSSLPFLRALNELKVKSEDTFYVADNPLIDFKGAKEAGIGTIRILRGEFLSVPASEDVDFEIKTLDELLEIAEAKA